MIIYISIAMQRMLKGDEYYSHVRRTKNNERKSRDGTKSSVTGKKYGLQLFG